jgi:hypothetical protein
MKYIYLVLCCITLSVNAQISNFWSVNTPQDFTFDGDIMYYVAQGSSPTSGFVAKVDFSASTPTAVNLVENITYPRAIAIDANFIYYNVYSQIFKISKTANNPTPVMVYNGVYEPKAFHIKNNELYIGEGDRISKIDISQSNPTKIDLVTGLTNFTLSFAEYNNELYYSTGYKVSKFSLATNTPTSSDVIINLEQRAYGIDFYNNFLYIDQTAVIGARKILKLDIQNINLGTEIIPANLPYLSGLGLKFKGNDLYFASAPADLIYVYPNIATLSTKDFVFNNSKLKIYPNPSSNFLKISDLKETKDYKIYDSRGVLIKSGKTSSSKEINIENFSTGIYSLLVDDIGYFKFLKK